MFRVGSIVATSVQRLLKDWESIEIEPTEDHIVYFYRHRIARRLYGFVLLQAKRRAGRITAEMGISCRRDYPIYPGRMEPWVAVAGVRDRLALVHADEDDRWWRYTSAETLESVLREILGEIRGRGFDLMKDRYESRIEREYAAAKRLVSEWRVLDAAAGERPLGSRFDGLVEEARANEYVERFVWKGSFEYVLGPLLDRYSDFGWLSCHVYLMARLLETLTEEDVPETTVPMVDGDEILAVTGRVPSYLYMLPAQTVEERILRHAFLKSLSMLEACFDGDALYEEGSETYGALQWE